MQYLFLLPFLLLLTIVSAQRSRGDVPVPNPPDFNDEKDEPTTHHPCENIQCELGKECLVNEEGIPYCTCIEDCLHGDDPRLQVCSNYNETWSSPCALYQMRCLCTENLNVCRSEQDKDLEIHYYGECKDPCQNIECGPGKECLIDENGRPICTCIESCLHEDDPNAKVCSNFKETWDSQCALFRMRCLCIENLDGCVSEQYKVLDIDSYGPCKSPCEDIKCGPGKVCLVDERRIPICTCIESCPDEDDPNAKVCSNFNETWDSQCALYRMRCLCTENLDGCASEQYKGLEIDSYGPCKNPCEDIVCGPGKECSVDEMGRPICTCVESCLDEDNLNAKVCSNFNETWNSPCALYRMKCLCTMNLSGCQANKYRDLTMNYYGSCRGGCKKEHLEDFPRRLREWFFIIMQELNRRQQLNGLALKLLHNTEKSKSRNWVYASLWKFCDLDVSPDDRYLSEDELLQLTAPLIAIEPCLAPFLKNCDTNDDAKIALSEWGICLGLTEDEIEDQCSPSTYIGKVE